MYHTLTKINFCLYNPKGNTQFWIILVFLDNPCLKINIFANVIPKGYHKRRAKVKPCTLVGIVWREEERGHQKDSLSCPHIKTYLNVGTTKVSRWGISVPTKSRLCCSCCRVPFVQSFLELTLIFEFLWLNSWWETEIRCFQGYIVCLHTHSIWIVGQQMLLKLEMESIGSIK